MAWMEARRVVRAVVLVKPGRACTVAIWRVLLRGAAGPCAGCSDARA